MWSLIKDLASEELVVVTILLGLMLLELLKSLFAAVFPGSGWRPLAGPAGSLPKVAQEAEKLYGPSLRAAGFHRLGSARRFFATPSVYDFWAAPELGLFATVTLGSISVSSDFLDGPAVVVSGQTRNPRSRGLSPKRRPGYWLQALKGEGASGVRQDIAGLLEAHRTLVAEFLRQPGATWTPWKDFSFEGMLAAGRAFERGYGRGIPLKNALGFAAIAIVLGAVEVALIAHLRH